MPVTSIHTPAMRWQALGTLVIGLTLSQSSLAVVHVSSSVSTSPNLSSAAKNPVSAKVVAPAIVKVPAVKAAVVKPVVVAVKPHHASARAVTHLPIQHVSLKATGNATHKPTAAVTSVSSGVATQNKSAVQ